MKAKIILICLFFVLFFNSASTLADPVFMGKTGIGFAGNIVIRQQTKVISGISVCEPIKIDLRILDIICLANIKSIDDYALWLQRTVQYRKDDNADVWSSPEETLAKKFGDCEDIAFFNKTFLRVLGYDPKVIALLRKGERKGHAICVFKEQGYYLWLDNTTLKRTSTVSIEEFAEYIFKNSAYASLSEISLAEHRT